MPREVTVGVLLIRRAIAGVIVIWGVVTMVFIILRVLPGDPAALALGMDATPQALEALRRQMGLDRPSRCNTCCFSGMLFAVIWGIRSGSRLWTNQR